MIAIAGGHRRLFSATSAIMYDYTASPIEFSRNTPHGAESTNGGGLVGAAVLSGLQRILIL